MGGPPPKDKGKGKAEAKQELYPADLFVPLASSTCDVNEVLDEFQELLFAASPKAADAEAALEIIGEVLKRERPEVVRLVLYGIDRAWLTHHFPTTAEDFLDSCAARVLAMLAAFFQNTPSRLLDLEDGQWVVGERRDQVRMEYRQVVNEAPGMLRALKAKMRRGLVAEEEEDGVRPKKMSQKQMKQARRAQALAKAEVMLDPAPFERLRIPLPEDVGEMASAIMQILEVQKGLLKVYLQALADEDLAPLLISACWLDRPAGILEAEPTIQLEPAEVPDDDPDAVETEIYAPAQPMKLTVFYNENVAQLGAWTISLSPRAERDLRDHRRRDRKVFKIVLKKIQELSNGHFSPDNQKRLNNRTVEIPVFEAKMTGDLRLVYQIDCVPM
ncbi:UvrD-like helicase ATP-binding domain-containing protein [Mycena kentingensis (nom. inval.)]|nr:UvrD-like helicase ATP-binding domain-containing protein [Mycena kentingensis (nom. inval.)]